MDKHLFNVNNKDTITMSMHIVLSLLMTMNRCLPTRQKLSVMLQKNTHLNTQIILEPLSWCGLLKITIQIKNLKQHTSELTFLKLHQYPLYFFLILDTDLCNSAASIHRLEKRNPMK